MPQSRPTVLLTGFGPFPSMGANATAVLVPRIAEAAAEVLTGVRIECHILPTEWGNGLFEAGRLYRHLSPAVAVHFGVSRRANGFDIETRARNWCMQAQDAAGLLPDGYRVSPYGPEHLPSTLPSKHIVDRLRRKGLPAMLSRDAGGYLCNALLYRSQELAREAPTPLRAGFVHLPADLVNERYPARGPLGSCKLGWGDVVEGGVEIIAASLGRPTPQWRHPARLQLG
jgi:pyroglutamyl-peptidase